MSAANVEKVLKVQKAFNVSKKGLFKKYRETPTIKLKGDFLTSLGFAIGDFVRVMVTDNYIQIIKDTKPGEEVRNV